eukprot:TRINITY_DN363_c0_g1_i8.p2 TRINITY_DN363_c0_g1~~TRINITY_DN363_c0_g1_i8.p2  ORF type:complete len:173 (-),score=27.41 TRINITY_DN363_c0_g1_i8:288-806(-)
MDLSRWHSVCWSSELTGTRSGWKRKKKEQMWGPLLDNLGEVQSAIPQTKASRYYQLFVVTWTLTCLSPCRKCLYNKFLYLLLSFYLLLSLRFFVVSRISAPLHLTSDQISAAVAGHLAFSLCDLERKKNGVEEGKFGVLTPASAAGKPLLKRLRDDGFEFVTLESSQVYEKL